MIVKLTFSKQAQGLIKELDLSEIKKWYLKEMSEIGGGSIHHFLLAKIEKKLINNLWA